MTDDKTRQATAPGDDTAQLEGQTMLEGFAPEPGAETEEDFTFVVEGTGENARLLIQYKDGTTAPPPEEMLEEMEAAIAQTNATMDRFYTAIHEYKEFMQQRNKSIEENEIILHSDSPLDKDTALTAYAMKELADVARDKITPEMWIKAAQGVADRLKVWQEDFSNGFDLLSSAIATGENFPLPEELANFLENKSAILETIDTFVSRFQSFEQDSLNRILSDVSVKVMERLANLSPEELAELERELYAEPGEPTETLDTVLEEAAIEVLQSGNIRQGTANNTLTKIKPTKRNTKVDPITHTATITHGDMVVTIPNWDKLTGLKTSAYQLLDACTTALTNTGWKRPQVAIRLSDYMQLRGLKDEKEARKQVNADLETLFNARISFKEKRRGKNTQNYADMRICDFKGIENGVIHFSFGSTFFELMKSYTIMPVQPQLFKLNSKRNPNSYYLLRRLMEHKNMNVGKLNEDIISVKTLLEACKEGIPSYEEVMAGNKHVTERIIDPFERDMNALEDTLTWEYCHSNGAPLADTELERLDYTTFSELLILTHWKNYPDQTARMERKQARIEEAKAKKKRGRKPKKPPEE